MKNSLLLILALLTYSLNAQVLSTSDAAILFSGSQDYGTARYNGMSGAFGALGGDLSAVDENPAGLAVFLNSEASVTANYRDTKITSDFYNTRTLNQDNYTRFSQAGGVFVFNNINSPNVNKVAIGFNYSIIRDFDNSFAVNGNSGTPDFLDDPYLNSDNNPNNDVFYPNVDGQSFINTTSGLHDKFTFSIASQYGKKLYLGASITSYNLDYFQNGDLAESDNNGADTLDASLIQQLQTNGNGFGFAFGIISKPSKEVRLGFSYQSPIWYNLTDQFTQDLQINVSNNPQVFTQNSNINVFDYRLFSPSVLTGSFAYIFGSEGLISFDYSYKNYKNIRLSPSGSFTQENQDFNANLNGVSKFKVGTEWRYKQLSFRGGYFYEQSPYKGSISSDNIDGFSVGLGVEIGGNSRIDFAYNKRSHTDIYKFLNASNPAELNIENSRASLSLILGL